MKFKINEEIFEKFQGLTIGVVVANGVNNSGASEEIQKQLRMAENDIRSKYNTETLSQNSKIDVWRKAYSAFGAKPKENKSSVESLYRQVLQGINVKHINNLVDIYNLVSLKHMVPVGGEDIDKMEGSIVLIFAGSNEVPVLLLGDKEPRPPHAGEVIYKDNISAVCRRWNWREAERTKLTEETKNCILVIEGLFPVTRQEVENAAKELENLLRTFCSGTVLYVILDKDKQEFDFLEK